jgi:hypothetical protein
MRPWLTAAAAVPLLSSYPAYAQVNPAQPLSAQKHHTTPNFRLPAIPAFTSQSPIQNGMIAQENLASNSHVALGLVPMLGRNIHSVRIEQELVPTRNPGVAFVVKFGR